MSEHAKQLIRENIRKHQLGEDATYLDLGNCGMTEVPKEISRCQGWLERLSFSSYWSEWNGIKSVYQKSQNNGAKNQIATFPSALSSLKNLKNLIFNDNPLSDLSPIAELVNLIELYCSKTDVSDLSPIAELANLQILYCANTSVIDLSPIAALHNLRLLYCSKTGVSDLSPIAELKNLQKLYCSETEISDLSPITELVNLRTIFCSETRISELGPIAALVNLETFDCHSTPVSDLSAIEKLPNLRKLYCSKTLVSDLEPISKLLSLQQLYCSETLVSNLEPISKLVNLEQLYCAETPVSNLEPIANLVNLQALNCSKTLVNNLDPIAKLVNLEILNCASTPISDLSPLKKIIEKKIEVKWSDKSRGKKGIYIKFCLLTNPPLEFAKKSNEAILSYWELIAKHGSTEISEAKLIIVGEGRTGKTTLFNKLTIPSFDLKKNPTDETHGINIHEGLDINENFRANLWDFGGQALQYMTHQFFMTPKALYILMMDDRTKSQHLLSWFRIINLLGKDKLDEIVSLILVLNKRKNSTDIPQYQDLIKKFEPHFDYQFLEVDFAENDKRWECLQEIITKRVVNLPIVKIKLPKGWKPIRDALREESKKKAYITMDRLNEICSKSEITKEEDQMQMTYYLHQLGSLLHFQNDHDLLDVVILQPEWAVNGVYTILKTERIRKEQKGRFTKEDIFNILNRNHYSTTDAQKILKLMSKNNFDICYESKSGDYVAAQFLPAIAPEYPWFPKDALQFRYQYPFKPEGLMSRLIVHLSSYIKKHEETREEMVWKGGAVLSIKNMDGDEECNILLREGDAESESDLYQIMIDVIGHPDARILALQHVRKTVESLHERWFWPIQVDKMVPCCCEECILKEVPYLYKLEDLRRGKTKGSDIICLVSFKTVKITLLLEGVYDNREMEELLGKKAERTEKLTILMLTANPADKEELNLKVEHSNIAEQLQSSDKLKLIVRHAVDKKEFIQFTEKEKPQILHFSGHGEPGKDYGGLVLQGNEKNRGSLIPTDALNALFEHFVKRQIPLNVVLLNICQSEELAHVIAGHIHYVIGTTIDIDDNLAIAFSTGFYSELAVTGNIERAYESGRTLAITEGAKKLDFVFYINGQKVVY